MEARTSKLNNFTHYDTSTGVAARPAVSTDPASKSYQRLARRIAVNALRGAVAALCRLGDVKDIREASYLLAPVLVRVQSAGGGK